MATEIAQNAEDHISRAQALLATAEDVTDEKCLVMVALARAHLEAANTLTKQREVQDARQMRLDLKSMQSGMLDTLGKVLPSSEEP